MLDVDTFSITTLQGVNKSALLLHCLLVAKNNFLQLQRLSHQRGLESVHEPLFLRLVSIVLISFCNSSSGPSLSDTSLFLSLRDENKLTLLQGTEAISSENTPSESLRPFRDTCCSSEGRSRPPPHGSAPTDAKQASRSLVFFSCSDGSGAQLLKRELKLNVPSDRGLCLQGPSRFVLLVKQIQSGI